MVPLSLVSEFVSWLLPVSHSCMPIRQFQVQKELVSQVCKIMCSGVLHFLCHTLCTYLYYYSFHRRPILVTLLVFESFETTEFVSQWRDCSKTSSLTTTYSPKPWALIVREIVMYLCNMSDHIVQRVQVIV